MPRTSVTPQEIKRTALVPVFVAGDAVNGHEFDNDGRTYVEVITAGTATNVTISIAAAGPDGLAVTNRVIACAATARNKIGPFPVGQYNQPNGKVNLDLSSATAVTLGVFRLPS